MSKTMLNRANKSCKYYPCHQGLEDCTFCYCPFYPCKDKTLGELVYSEKRKTKVWSCSECNWIHKKRVVDNILGFIANNRNNFLPVGASLLGAQKALASEKIGIIILAHGSKLKAPALMMEKSIVNAVKQSFRNAAVMAAYLQFCRPDLSESIKDIIKNGSKRIIIVPFFLFMGNHVTRDVPALIRTERKKYPDVSIICTRNIGTDHTVRDIVLSKIKEVL